MDRSDSMLRAGRRIALVLAAVVGGASCGMEPDVGTEVRTLRDVELTHTHVAEHVVGGDDPSIIVRSSTNDLSQVLAGEGLRLYFRERGAGTFTKVILGAAGSRSVFLASIPVHERGTRIEYYIEVRGSGGELLTFPGRAGEGVYYTLLFKGHVPRPITVVHVLGLVVGLLLFLYGSYRAWRFLRGDGAYGTMESACVSGFAVLVALAFPAGLLMGYYATGAPWSGFPPGGDHRQTATLVDIVYWLVVLWLFRASTSDPEREGTRRRFARLVIIGTLLTALSYAIPHDI